MPLPGEAGRATGCLIPGGKLKPHFPATSPLVTGQGPHKQLNSNHTTSTLCSFPGLPPAHFGEATNTCDVQTQACLLLFVELSLLGHRVLSSQPPIKDNEAHLSDEETKA